MRAVVPEILRVKILIRDKFECQECGRYSYIKQNLWKKHSDHEIHHVYSNENNDPLNLITLCNKCHLKAHGGDWRNKPIKTYDPQPIPEFAEDIAYIFVYPLEYLAEKIPSVIRSRDKNGGVKTDIFLDEIP